MWRITHHARRAFLVAATLLTSCIRSPHLISLGNKPLPAPYPRNLTDVAPKDRENIQLVWRGLTSSARRSAVLEQYEKDCLPCHREVYLSWYDKGVDPSSTPPRVDILFVDRKIKVVLGTSRHEESSPRRITAAVNQYIDQAHLK
jgi:hypothetical protein